MKIAVYGISKNEGQFVDRFMQTANEADVIVIGDTGSTDNTVDLFEKHEKVEVWHLSVQPWRFDVARNTVLSLLPDDVDICWSVDIDECLEPGWRQKVEAAWTPETTRGIYDFVWSHDTTGEPLVSFKQHKLHSRSGYRWKSPLHEDLVYYGTQPELEVSIDTVINHYPDPAKSRSNYLPLLEIAVKEDPSDARISHYLGREYMYTRQFDKAIEELFRNTIITDWMNEKATSYIYISECYLEKNNLEWAERYAHWAIDTFPDLREAHFQAAKVAYIAGQFEHALEHCKLALNCTIQYPTYMNSDNRVWHGSVEFLMRGIEHQNTTE